MSLKIGEGLSLPRDVVTQTLVIFGKRGSGKSNFAAVLAEQLYHNQLPFVVLDPQGAWWGLKSSKSGKRAGLSVYVFGGPHGDLPLEPHAGALIADVIVDHRISVILDIKEFSGREATQFVTDFAERLFRRNTEPLHLILEEAEQFIPQRPFHGEERMLGAMEKLVKRGRSYGLGVTAITQRSASVNKNVTTQAEVLVCFRILGPQDRDAVDQWIKYHGDQSLRQEVLSSLPTLPTGTAWIWAPEWPENKPVGLKQAAIYRRETYDSASTPKPGEHRTPPKHLASVDLAKLKDKMRATVEKAEAEDPRLLRQQLVKAHKIISEIGKERDYLAKERIASKRKVVTQKPVKFPSTTQFEKLMERANKLADRLSMVSIAFGSEGSRLSSALSVALNHDPVVAHEFVGHEKKGRPVRERELNKILDAMPRDARGNLRIEVNPDSPGGKLQRSGLYRMLVALAQRGKPLTARSLAVRSGLKQSGTYDTYLSRGRSQGWIEGDRQNLRITEKGLKEIGDYTPLPEGVALAHYWLTKLGNSGAFRILQTLLNVYPTALDRDELAAKANLARSGTFDTYLSRLRSLELVTDRHPGLLRASDELFD